MNSAFSNLALMLIMMQVSRRLNLENPDTLFYVRTGYLACQILSLIIYLYTRYKINSKNDLTVLKYVQPSSPILGETEPKAIITTVKEYDLQQVNTQIKSIFTSLLMMGFMHLYMKYNNPLVMLSVSTIKSALETNIVKIHLFGKPASGSLKRPFKASPGFLQSLTGSSDFKTDKQSVENAEISGNGGIKED